MIWFVFVLHSDDNTNQHERPASPATCSLLTVRMIASATSVSVTVVFVCFFDIPFFSRSSLMEGLSYPKKWGIIRPQSQMHRIGSTTLTLS